MTKIINLMAAPGIGKSTVGAGLFYQMKLAGYKVELITEYAKDLTYEDRTTAIKCQPYVFGKQLMRLTRLHGHVDYIINDSPIFLSALYSQYPEDNDFFVNKFKSMNNINILLNRGKIPYQSYGRKQTLTESNELQNQITILLRKYNILYYPVLSVNAIPFILELIKHYDGHHDVHPV